MISRSMTTKLLFSLFTPLLIRNSQLQVPSSVLSFTIITYPYQSFNNHHVGLISSKLPTRTSNTRTSTTNTYRSTKCNTILKMSLPDESTISNKKKGTCASSSTSDSRLLATRSNTVSSSFMDRMRNNNNDDFSSFLSTWSNMPSFSPLSSLSSFFSNSSSSSTLLPQEWFASKEGLLEILSASFLIISNTVGPSILALPEVVKGPGLLFSTSIFFGLFIINLISGLLIAEVSIHQYESFQKNNNNINQKQEYQVPSSFKEFADVNLNSPMASTIIAFLSVFMNGCVLSYNLIKSGEILSNQVTTTTTTTSVSPLIDMVGTSTLSNDIVSPIHIGATLTALVMGVLVGTQSDKTLSGIASVCCFVLFTSFGGLVLPSLVDMFHHGWNWDWNDIMIQLSTSMNSIMGGDNLLISSSSSLSSSMTDSSSQWSSDVMTAIPVMISAMIYQNIVPSVTKLLNYDRSKTISALTLGSLIPTLMFVVYCCIMQDGITSVPSSSSSSNLCILGLSISSLIGSSMACVMSLSEEFESFLKDDLKPASIIESRPQREEECQHNDDIRDDESMTNFVPSSLVNVSSSSHSKDNNHPNNNMMINSNNNKKNTKVPTTNTSGLSVLLATAPSLLAGILFSHGESFTSALSMSGSYGSPILYGLVPILLLWNHRNDTTSVSTTTTYASNTSATTRPPSSSSSSTTTTTTLTSTVTKTSVSYSKGSESLVPGGFASWTTLGIASLSLLTQQVTNDVTSLLDHCTVVS